MPQPNTRDGRSHLFGLTREGRDIHSEIMRLALDMEVRLLECLTPAEQRSSRKTLDKLFVRAKDFDADPV